MVRKTLFCVPGRIYSSLPEFGASEAYTRMAITGFDELIKFRKDYDLIKEVSDKEEIVGKKDGRTLVAVMFLNQPVIQIGEIPVNIISSSYLFNVLHDLGVDNLLPDLDVIDFKGRKRSEVQVVSDIVADFYRRAGFDVAFVGEGMLHSHRAQTNFTRSDLGKSVEILDLEDLRIVAEKVVKYNRNKLAFVGAA